MKKYEKYDDEEKYYNEDENDIDMESNSVLDDDYNEDEFSDIYDEDEFFKDDDSAPSKKERKKDYYVKGADLKEELKKYHSSKAESEDGQRIYI